MKITLVGRWAFFLGLILAIVAGLGGVVPGLITALFILGLIVGFINVTEKESTAFLVAVIALLLIGVAGLQIGKLTDVIVAILKNLISFIAAAGLIVAVKQVLVIAKEGD